MQVLGEIIDLYVRNKCMFTCALEGLKDPCGMEKQCVGTFVLTIYGAFCFKGQWVLQELMDSMCVMEA